MLNNTVCEVIDRDAVLRQFDNDAEFAEIIISEFMESYTELLRQVEEAIKEGNCRSLQRAAHTLKGTVMNFYAAAAVEAARRLEAMGREGDLAKASETLNELKHEIERLKPALVALVEELCA